MEDNVSGRDEELEYLQQEVIRIKEQHVDLQAHTEDLKNRWCWRHLRTSRIYWKQPEISEANSQAPVQKGGRNRRKGSCRTMDTDHIL
ncbi:hypothetical protein NDU88_005102 [Pleurodeles waltl]|uniref:Uncharacterized protein n=1 Tax=Pleurodeles waltl TaxID=8319 RepID=A0AAV7M907_PLEWA|nr:hypothetical protein NDU88_005102 [Pleurodeles waltl]